MLRVQLSGKEYFTGLRETMFRVLTICTSCQHFHWGSNLTTFQLIRFQKVFISPFSILNWLVISQSVFSLLSHSFILSDINFLRLNDRQRIDIQAFFQLFVKQLKVRLLEWFLVFEKWYFCLQVSSEVDVMGIYLLRAFISWNQVVCVQNAVFGAAITLGMHHLAYIFGWWLECCDDWVFFLDAERYAADLILLFWHRFWT